MNYQSLSKRAKTVMLLTAIIQGILFSAAALLIIAKVFGRGSETGLVLALVCAALAIAYIIIVPIVRFKRYRYLIETDRIEIVEGVFFIKRTLVPIDRIHQISVSRGPIDSAFGVAKVSVITAGATATFRFLDEEKADEIALHLNTRIKEKLGGSENVQ
ncbi:MAG: PH domain-containing protein [Clostridia bacterium]|nr:PH domain-containing protein [Clostridia bacterium]MBQ7101078.1 PH domain-containing protein [Clostridia bacterium]